jgi:aspartyl-tRNA(Asn)/glutamyl-tRNA(Gln) amidotransferase subunit A
MTDLLQKNISDLLRAYRSHETTPEEVCREVFAKIDRYDSKTGAFLKLDREGAMFAAKEAGKDLNRPLAGVPIAIKDNISTKNLETTCSSKILKGYVPPYDATVIARLKNAGAIILGKTNCDEFAMGSSTENSAFQLTRNPWKLECTPGGSSGGSTVAVACGYAFAGLGSDTGGSIRQPASLCGMIGVKPTYGRVSRYGLVAFGSSLDCIGPLARTAEDAALMLQVIAGHDPLDSTSAKSSVPEYSSDLNFKEPLRVGIPDEYFGEGLNSEVGARIQDALKWMEASGKVQLKKISLPNTRYAISVYYVVATAEASSNLSRYDGVKYGYRAPGQNSLHEMYAKTRDQGFGAEVKRRVMLGTFVLSSGYYDAYYLKALKVRSLIANDFNEAFKDVDVICTPTSPTPAFPIGEKVDDPLAMYLSDIYTVTINLAGLPAVSIPCGFTSDGLPVGLQIISNHLQESQMFQLSSFYLKEHPVQLPSLSWNK